MKGRVSLAIASLGVTQIIGWGSTYYLLTVMARPIGAELGLAPEFVAIGHSLFVILNALCGPLAGRIMDRRGAQIVMVWGSGATAVGLVVLATATGPVSFLLAWIILGITGAMILYSAAFTALTQLDPLHARRNISLLTLPGGLASTVFWPLGVWLLTVLDWRHVLLVYAALNIAICLPLHLAFLGTNGGRLPKLAAGKPAEEGLPQAAQKRAFILFATMLALNALVVAGFLNQFLALFAAIGHSGELALAVGMTFGIAQVAARIVEAALGGRFTGVQVGIAACAMLAMAFAVLPFSGGSTVLGMAFGILLGASNGLITIVRAILVLSLFGPQGYGERTGTVAVAQGFTSALAPFLFAAILTRLGAPVAAWFGLVVSVAALGCMMLLARHVRVHTDRVRK